MTYQTYKCAACGEEFSARAADRKRGWAKFCSKSCKAIKQEQRTGQYKAYKGRQERREDEEMWGDDDQSWDAHKSWLP